MSSRPSVPVGEQLGKGFCCGDGFRNYPPQSTLLGKIFLFGGGFKKYPPRSTILGKTNVGDRFEKIPIPEHLT